MQGHDHEQDHGVSSTTGAPRGTAPGHPEGRRRAPRGARGGATASALRRAVTALSAAALAFGVVAAVPVVTAPAAQAAAATTNAVTVKVTSARTEEHFPGASGWTTVTEGAPVTNYRYMISVDNAGKSAPYGGPKPGSGCSAEDANYPADCSWPSVLQDPGAAPIYRQGTSADFADGTASLDLPDGDYLITVLADNYKIDGTHFTVPLEEPNPGAPGVVSVGVQPDPLPDSTLRAQVFLDEASTNGAIDNGEPGLAGFQGHINDTLGEVTTDVYGNPLCTVYAGENPDTHAIPWTAQYRNDDGTPKTISAIGGKCFSDSTGMLTIPHLGTNRYTTTVSPPDGTSYIQTTTLEGNHDFDTWLMENSTGYDTEATVGGEPVPTPQFGFVKPNTPSLGGSSGSITGTVVAVKQYYPPVGGSFNYLMGMTGAKLDKPIEDPVISLQDLGNGDQAVWVGRGDAQGHFSIPHVPDGNYQLTWWDEPQNYILQLVNVTVSNGEAVDLKQLPLTGWWTQLSGHVFLDANKNGKRDPGEQGVAQFPLTMRKKDNSLMDRGSTAVGTDSTGFYSFESAYPLSEWVVMEAYSDNFYTTGITYQADNQPTPTTVLGSGVDVSTLPIIGLSGTVDWGVQKYVASKGENGGIVGSVSYDTTRNELDPQYAATEDWQPGIPNIPVRLYAPVECPGDGVTPCDATDRFVLDTDGSLLKGKLLNSYLSEHWSPPSGCTARDVDGNPIAHPAAEDVLSPAQSADGECVAALVNGVQFGPYPTDQGGPDANFGATVDGNYGFGDVCPAPGTLDDTDPANPTCQDLSDPTHPDVPFTPITADSYLVSVDIPNDASGHPEYSVTSEEDINIARGDAVAAQVPPPSCAGALHTVDLADAGTDGYPEKDLGLGVKVPASTPVDNATFADIGGSPYEGTAKARCDTKLVDLNNGKSIVPMFHLFTDVPVPSRLRGLIVDDLNFSVDKRTVLFGDKAGVPYAPVGIYDYTGRLVHTAESDFNGYYDVLMPSTDHISCPTPSGVCTNLYRFVGNDPGIPGHLNANYNPRFRTIATEFEAMPGVTIPTDLAPTQVGVSVGVPGTSPTTVQCLVNEAAPQLFRVSKPFIRTSDNAAARQVKITGDGFGPSQGTHGGVALDSQAAGIVSWSDTEIVATMPIPVPGGTFATGAHQLTVTADNGKKTVNGLTFHVLGNGYNLNVYEVGPGHSQLIRSNGSVTNTTRYDPTSTGSESGTIGVRHAIQNALDDAGNDRSPTGSRVTGDDLVVVYPNEATAGNPRGAYYENLVVTRAVKLQGVGAGGFQGPNNNSPYVQGTVIDGAGFAGDSGMATDWLTRVDAAAWLGDATVSDGAVISLFADTTTRFATSSNAFTPLIDGMDIRGGDQQGVPGNINNLTGQLTNLPPNISTQGGAVYAHAYVAKLQVSNNVVENNGGSYGTIRIGTPDIPAPNSSQHNPGTRIVNNRIVQNAGTNLAGAVGLFAGADGYEVSGNDICGNFSLEYGAGVSVYGLSPNGKILDNRISLNNSNDEGGGIMIAGALPADPDVLSEGSGPVEISANHIQGNLANDDGGGIRFLQAGDFPMTVSNNVIAGNISTHEGGGIGINDAPNVQIVNNTIMDNITTATAVTSNGIPAPAGVSTSENSQQLQATLSAGSPSFSKPVLFNNVLWNNRAGTRAGTTVTGIGLDGDTTAVDLWDVGVADSTGTLAPANSVIQQDPNGPHPFTVEPDAGNSAADPRVKETWAPSVAFATWRQNPAFVDATLVTPTAAGEVPPDLMGDYHLQACSGAASSPACDLGAVSRANVTAPATDIDGDARPSSTSAPNIDAGSDEVVRATPPPPPPPTIGFLFSTAGNATVPGVAGTADDADVYSWNGSAYGRAVHVTDSQYGVPASANVDGLAVVDATHFYLSFAADTTLTPSGGAPLTVQDEDVVYWNGSAWSVYFDGTAHGLTSNALDVNAISVRNGNLFFATFGSANPPGVTGTPDDADLYRWNGTAYARVFDASVHGIPAKARVDGAVRVDAKQFYLSFSTDTSLRGFGSVQDEDIVALQTTGTGTQAGTDKWTTWFNGTAHGLTTASLNIDAFSLPTGATAP